MSGSGFGKPRQVGPNTEYETMRSLSPALRAVLIVLTILFLAFGWGVYSVLNLRSSSVVRVNSQDPRLQAAVRQAKDGLDGFLKELESPKPDDGFAVKGMFQTPYGPEYLWVRRPVYKDGMFSGVLDQEPMALPAKKKGDAVKFAKKDLVDWLIKDDRETRGAFTERALNGP